MKVSYAFQRRLITEYSESPFGVAALFHHFKDPVMIVEGKMQYLYDEHQRRYLDVSSHLLALHLPHIPLQRQSAGQDAGIQSMSTSMHCMFLSSGCVRLLSNMLHHASALPWSAGLAGMLYS